MDVIEFTPSGVCSRKMIIEIEDDIVRSYRSIGGCPGNSLGIGMLVKDRPIDEVIERLKDIRCGMKSTSCPGELAKALIKYKNEKK